MIILVTQYVRLFAIAFLMHFDMLFPFSFSNPKSIYFIWQVPLVQLPNKVTLLVNWTLYGIYTADYFIRQLFVVLQMGLY